MIRSTTLAAAAALALLAGCGGAPGTANSAAADTAGEGVADNLTVEDLPSDGLAAPADAPLDSESNTVGSASGGNAM